MSSLDPSLIVPQTSSFVGGLSAPGGLDGTISEPFVGGLDTNAVYDFLGGKGRYIAAVIVVLLLLVIVIPWAYRTVMTWKDMTDGFRGDKGSFLGHVSLRDDTGFTTRTNRDNLAFAMGMRPEQLHEEGRTSGFINAREGPYYPDVTNRVLRMENREREAIRALGKINQERLRRKADTADPADEPIPWDQFWADWKVNHPMEGDPVISGFSGETISDVDSKFEY